jgi:hypothetical protein
MTVPVAVAVRTASMPARVPWTTGWVTPTTCRLAARVTTWANWNPSITVRLGLAASVVSMDL